MNLAFPNFVITLHTDPSLLPFPITHMMTSNSPGTRVGLMGSCLGQQVERVGTRRDAVTASASLPPPSSIATALIAASASSQHQHHPSISIIPASASSQHQHHPSHRYHHQQQQQQQQPNHHHHQQQQQPQWHARTQPIDLSLGSQVTL